MQRFFNAIERAGNRLPHPVVLFASLCLGVALLSWALAAVAKPSMAAEVVSAIMIFFILSSEVGVVVSRLLVLLTDPARRACRGRPVC